MRWWERALAIFGLGRARPSDPYTRHGLGPLQFAPSGVRIDMDTALEVSAVWACITLISDSLAASPCNVFRSDPLGRREIMPDDTVAYLMNVRPSPEYSASSFREAIMMSVLLWGNGYAVINRDIQGRVRELQFLEASRVTPRRRGAEDGWELYYEYRQPNGGRIDLEMDEVLHFKGPGVTAVMGDNMVSRGTLAMSIAMAQERFSGAYFGQNTVLGGYLSLDGTLSDEAQERLQKSWNAVHRGPDSAFKVPLLEEGLKFNQMDVNAEASQLIQSRTFSVQDICRLYRVPPHLIQDLSRGTFAALSDRGWTSLTFKTTF